MVTLFVERLKAKFFGCKCGVNAEVHLEKGLTLKCYLTFIRGWQQMYDLLLSLLSLSRFRFTKI